MTIKVPVRPIPALEETVLNCVTRHNHMAAIPAVYDHGSCRGVVLSLHSPMEG